MFLNISTQTEQKYFYQKNSNVNSKIRSIFDDYKAVDQKPKNISKCWRSDEMFGEEKYFCKNINYYFGGGEKNCWHHGSHYLWLSSTTQN